MMNGNSMSSHTTRDDDDIVKADNLWFGENGHKLNRDASVSLFQNLHQNVDTSMIDGHHHQGEDDVNISHDYGSFSCENGVCCEHRRNNTNQLPQQQQTTAPSLQINDSKSVCVIGAGPSGLITIKELQHKGFTNIKCYEASSHIGGAFAAAYEGATMTSSNLLTCFGCYTLSEYELDRQKFQSDDNNMHQEEKKGCVQQCNKKLGNKKRRREGCDRCQMS